MFRYNNEENECVNYCAAALFLNKKLSAEYVRSSAVCRAALLPSTCF